MVYAFFDVDGTILKINSMLNFFDYWTTKNKLHTLRDSFYSELKVLTTAQSSREVKNKAYYSFFKGFSDSEIRLGGLSWFNDNILNKDVFFDKVVFLINEHKLKNHKIVFVSGSMLSLLEPIGKHLNVDDILCVNLIKDRYGILTGDIDGHQTIGLGKRNAMVEYAHNNNILLERCYSYGDDISDLPMLDCVGHAVCVGENNDLSFYAENAKNKKWKVLSV